jgi:hypothetical protein
VIHGLNLSIGVVIFRIENAEAGAGAMLVACRLAGLSALETYYAGVRGGGAIRPTQRSRRHVRMR